MATNILLLPNPITVTFRIKDNEQWRDSFQVIKDGSPLDISGILWLLYIRSTTESIGVLQTLSSALGEIVVGGAVNSVWGTLLSRTKVKRIGIGTFPLDCVGYADGVERVLMEGTIEVARGIVQP